MDSTVDRASGRYETDEDRVRVALNNYGTSCLFNLDTDDEVPEDMWGDLLSQITCNSYGLAEYCPPQGRR